MDRSLLLLLALSGCQPPSGVDTGAPADADTDTDTDTDADTDTDTDTDTDIGPAPDVGAIAVGANGRVCRVEPVGTLACWGPAAVGDGTTAEAALPSRVVGLDDVVGAATMQFHSCALRADGGVACWGENRYHELGDLIRTNEVAYVPLDLPLVVDAVQIATGLHHSCVRHTGGTVSCWGNPASSAAGDPDGTAPGTPLVAPGIDAAVDVSAGAETTCVASADGAVACWGRNASGQLGDGTTDESAAPVAVDGVDDAVGVSAGWEHACAVLGDGGVACWGVDESNLWAPGSTGRVPGMDDAVAVDAGFYFTCALRAGGTVACWGGVWAHPEVTDVEGLDEAVALSVEGDRACALRRDGEAWCWSAADDIARPVPRAPEVAEPVDTCPDDTCEAFAWPVAAPAFVVRDAVIADRTTGLVWQRQAPDGRLVYADAHGYCDALVLDGRADWRLPSRAELLSIHDTDADEHALDTALFHLGADSAAEGGTGVWTWTDSEVGYPEGWYATIGATHGAPSIAYPGNPYAVRCVRSPEPRDLSLRYEADATSVLDTFTGLRWERDPPTDVTDQPTAEARCAALVLDGLGGWRLPHVDQLQSLVDPRWSAPALDPAFGADASDWYWSDSRWSVHFAEGDTRTYDVVALDKRARCVQ